MLTIERGGRYFRLAKPDWLEPLDHSFSKAIGGRWNPPGEFGALYLSRTVEVAAANARRQHIGRAIGLFDLRPERRPILVSVDVAVGDALDVVTPKGVRGLKLPAEYPYGVGHDRCQPIGRRALRAGLPGVACRSNAECTPTDWIGEELAWFDSAPPPTEIGARARFAQWYPDHIP
jgi:hypothetical protein